MMAWVKWTCCQVQNWFDRTVKRATSVIILHKIRFIDDMIVSNYHGIIGDSLHA